MTYIEALDPNSPRNIALDAAVDQWDEHTPGWQDAERYGDTLVSEDDFPVYDTSADDDRVSNEDWEAFLSDRW